MDDTTDDTTVAFLLKEASLAQEKEKAALEESEKQAKEQKEQRAMKEARCWTRTTGHSNGRVQYQHPSSSSSASGKKRKKKKRKRRRRGERAHGWSRPHQVFHEASLPAPVVEYISPAPSVSYAAPQCTRHQHVLLCTTQHLWVRSTGTDHDCDRCRRRSGWRSTCLAATLGWLHSSIAARCAQVL